MTRKLCVALIALGLSVMSDRALAGFRPQFPPPPPATSRQVSKPQASGTSRIVGQVVRVENGAPVRRAVVLLYGEALPDGRSVVTDADGRFDSGNLPAGSYRLTAAKDGLLSAEFGTKAYGEPGQPVKVGENEKVENVNIAMIRGGAIAGRVVDEYGEPVTAARVQVQREHAVEGVRRLEVPGAAKAALTDDLGQYRVYGLPPGSYLLSASLLRQAEPDLDAAPGTGLAPTYHPGTTNVQEARPLEVIAGQDLAGIDVALTLVRTARLSGTCLDASGKPLVSGSVSAFPVAAGSRNVIAGMFRSAQLDAGGAFSIGNVAAGDYLLIADTGNSVPPQRGATRVTVTGTDVSGIVVQTTLASTLLGQIVFDDNVARRSVLSRVVPSAPPAEPGDFLSAGSSGLREVRDDGSFRMTGLFGDHFVNASVPAGWAVKGVFQGDRDITDTPISFDGREPTTGVQIILTDRLTHLTVTVTPSAGSAVPEDAEIVVAADDPARWKTALGGRYKRRMFSQDGSPATFDGLPPGDYFAVAVGDARAPDMLLDSDVLGQLRRVGQRFSLKEGETKQLAVKVSKQE